MTYFVRFFSQFEQQALEAKRVNAALSEKLSYYLDKAFNAASTQTEVAVASVGLQVRFGCKMY